ncbi:MAG: hypothetical protein NTX75_06930 [Proteobacteria bacterium]|nr:hypothetical protein [Pseudomonadota bacterium]
MNIMENFYQIAFILLTSVGGAVIIIAALSTWLGKVWANRILESDKAKYTQELDKIRHQFQIEFDQLSIIHENQKSSFQRMIKELHKSIKSLEQAYDEAWQPISDKHYDALKEVIIEESLFLGAEGEKALNIYLDFLGKAVYFPEDESQDDKTLRNIYEFLNFMSERIREYFRKRIGLSSEANPLLDINLIAACILVNGVHFTGTNFPTNQILLFQYDISPSSFVEKLKENMSALKSELNTLISCIESDRDEGKYSFRVLSEARYYLNLFNEA